MHKNKDVIVNKILRAIEEAGFSHREFARKFGIAENLISDWKRGTVNPSINSIRKVAKATKKDLNWFLDIQDEHYAQNEAGYAPALDVLNQYISKLESENYYLKEENAKYKAKLTGLKQSKKTAG